MIAGASDDELLIQVMPHGTAAFGGIISAATVTIHYDAGSSLSLGPATSFCSAWSAFAPSAVVVNNGVAYRTYNGFGANRIGDPVDDGGCNTVLVPEEWFTLATIPVLGEGCTDFTLDNDAFTDAHNRSFYVSLNGWEVTGVVVDGTLEAGDCSEVDCLGIVDGTALPGTPCDDGNPGTVNDTWTEDCECVGTVPCVPASITFMSSNSPICANGTLVLQASAAGTGPLDFTWTGTGTFSPGNQGAQVSVANAASGTYSVTVTNACGSDLASLTVMVDSPLSGTISYEGSPYCGDGGPEAVVLTGTPGGQFSATPSGLGLEASTGTIDPSASLAGTYTVSYTVGGNTECPGYTTSTVVTIVGVPSASIQYGTVCGSGALPVSLTGMGGGTFSAAPAGLVLDAATGTIDLGASTAGSYVVTYTIAATEACGEFSTSAPVTVYHPSTGSIHYDGSPYCVNGGVVPVTQTGSTGGTYSVSPPGLSVDPNDGSIDLDASTVGVYQVTYTVPANGPCPAFSTSATVLVGTSLLATIGYNNGPYCIGGGFAQVTRTGTMGGQYSASPIGLAINSATGAINLGSSTPGLYTVTYTIAASGSCGDFSTTTQVEVLPALTATIMYGESPYCMSTGLAMVSFGGDEGGSFSAVPAGLSLDGNTGAIDLEASQPGTYTVTYTIQNSTACAFSTSTQVVVLEVPWAEISYGADPYCANGGVAAVVHNGTMGGTYTSSPEGLALNEANGYIVLQSSTPGSYTVTYTLPAAGPCPAFSTTAEVTVQQPLIAAISYPGSPFCSGGGQGLVSFSGDAGGAFSASPAGLALDPGSGTIDLDGSSPGFYMVSYTVEGPEACGAFSTTAPVLVQEAPWAAISYGAGPYCTSGGVIPVSLTGSQGGTYSSSPAGLALNENTGFIILPSSTPGTYTVTYTTLAVGPCAAFTTTTEVVVLPAPTAVIDYPGSPFCAGGGQGLVAFSGDAGGTFSSSPAGLALDPASGLIDLVGSSPGTYTVTYNVAGSAGCDAFSTTAQVVVQEAAWASIGYEDGPYCTSGGSALVTRTGTAGGTYSASPAGLSLDPSTGMVNLGASTPGTYSVTYAVPAIGPCDGFSTSAEITVQPAPTAAIVYEGSPYCSTAGQAVVSFTGTPGGTYSATPAGLSINETTGMINLYMSTPGSYSVTYVLAADGGCAAISATAGVEITPASVGAIGYNDDPYCTGDNVATVVQVGTPGGTYSAVPAGLSIDANTGAIDLSGSTGGTYLITYAIPPHGGCPEFSNSTTFILFTVGEPCDDGNAVTVNDVITEDCICAGDIIDGVEDLTGKEIGLLLYPNPNRTGRFIMHVEGLDGGLAAAEVRMLDAVGRQVYAVPVRAVAGMVHEEIVLPGDLAQGIYLVELVAGDQRVVGRLVIE